MPFTGGSIVAVYFPLVALTVLLFNKVWLTVQRVHTPYCSSLQVSELALTYVCILCITLLRASVVQCTVAHPGLQATVAFLATTNFLDKSVSELLQAKQPATV